MSSPRRMIRSGVLLLGLLLLAACDQDSTPVPTPGPTQVPPQAATAAPTQAATPAAPAAPTQAPTQAVTAAPTQAATATPLPTPPSVLGSVTTDKAMYAPGAPVTITVELRNHTRAAYNGAVTLQFYHLDQAVADPQTQPV